MSFEDSMLNRIDRNRSHERRSVSREGIKDPIMDLAYERARKLMSSPDYAIQAPDFFDVYTEEKVRNDMLQVMRKRMRFGQNETPEMRETKKASDVFEALVMHQAELSDWLGSNVSVMKTSLYDDYFNGTDMIAEWREADRKSNILALAVDVTFGKSSVERKLRRLREDAEGGKLGTIKYFQSSDGKIRREKKDVPHVVIGVSKQTVEQLARLWLRNDTKALAAHPIQRALIEEMYLQLNMIQKHATARGQTRVAEAYQGSLAIVEKIREEKMHVPLGELENDRVYNEIQDQCRAMFHG
jgi:hypothetical protein